MFDVFYTGQKPNLHAHELPVRSIAEARVRSRTRYFWLVNYLTDYTGFDFLWEPAPWQSQQVHAWPSQHQSNGGTMLIPKHEVTDINREHATLPRNRSVPRLHIKHSSDSEDQGDVNTRYISDYLGTIRRALKHHDWEWCWVTSDVCDYDKFDFTWHPSEWQQDLLHVFASNEQKFGDTFYVHVPSFLERTQDLKILEWYPGLNFVDDISVPRWPAAGIWYRDDTVVKAIWEHEFVDPVVQFFHRLEDLVAQPPTINLWQESTKTVIPLSRDNSVVLVPRECKNYLRDQVYDYPHLDKAHRDTVAAGLQDIIYISYDEPEAEENYQLLLAKFPNVIRVHGVSGMENALKNAASRSTTPWFFAVFAKTQLNPDFDFSHVPDYMQQPKHYIFYCHNLVNDLKYGHMGIIMYNRHLTLTAPAYEDLGLDWTMSFPHEIIPEVSCFGKFDTTPYHTWRTAFREASKLAYFNSIKPSVDNQYRLDVWCNRAQGDHAEWCLRGARDGVEFFQESAGDLAVLKHSFRWEWLQQRFQQRWGLVD